MTINVYSLVYLGFMFLFCKERIFNKIQFTQFFLWLLKWRRCMTFLSIMMEKNSVSFYTNKIDKLFFFGNWFFSLIQMMNIFLFIYIDPWIWLNKGLPIQIMAENTNVTIIYLVVFLNGFRLSNLIFIIIPLSYSMFFFA